MGVSAPSLHRESTDSLMNYSYKCTCVYSTTQVIALDERCRPRYLKHFSNPSSNAHFGIICSNLTLHFANVITDNSTVVVHELSTGCQRDTEGILVESNNGVQALSVTDTTIIDVCGVNSGGSEVLTLPLNVYCERDTNLYPLHGHDAFLLQCTSSSGVPTLYVVSLHPDVDAQSISAKGRPYSSPNGEYVVVLDAQKATVYNVRDTTSPGNAKGFPASITTIEFLDSHHVLFLTEDNKQFLIDLENISSAANDFSGGQAISWMWVNSSKVFVYATKGDDDIYTVRAFSTTSAKTVFEVKGIVNKPEMTLFVEKSRTTDPPPGRNERDNTVLIVSSTVGAVVFTVAASVFAAALLAYIKSRIHVRPARSRSSIFLLCPESNIEPKEEIQMSPTEEIPPTLPMEETSNGYATSDVCPSNDYSVAPYDSLPDTGSNQDRPPTATATATKTGNDNQSEPAVTHPSSVPPASTSAPPTTTATSAPPTTTTGTAPPTTTTSSPPPTTTASSPPPTTATPGHLQASSTVLQQPEQSDPVNVTQRNVDGHLPFPFPNGHSYRRDTSTASDFPYAQVYEEHQASHGSEEELSLVKPKTGE